jgi:2OG-Fe(II) oxygenase superfamily
MLETAESPRTRTDVLQTSMTELHSSALLALARGEVLVVRVRQFINPEACEKLSERAEDLGYGAYLNVPSVRRIGMAFYETEGQERLLNDYFRTAGRNIQDFRDACAPYCSPVDALRCKLDEIWPSGARLQTLSGKKMFVGLSRMVQPGTTFLAHHDIFSEDAPTEAETHELLAQFGANVYIKMPAQGGDLLMWRKEIPPALFNQMRGDDYGVQIQRLGAPDVVVKPACGDLLIFNSRKMHAVAPGTGSNRLALSCFVGYRGANVPLTFWS